MDRQTPIYVAGHRGLAGSAIHARLVDAGYTQLITASSKELDLTCQQATADFLAQKKPQAVIIAAAKVGGIVANNTYGADFIYQNLMIAANLIHQSRISGVQRLMFLGSSCVYPRESRQPMQEKQLLTGALEPTNAPYAIAKIAGIHMCHAYYRQYQCDFRAVMPCNLYGENDNFHSENSHVIPGMIRKLHAATRQDSPTVTFWGSGKVRREFLHVDDMADACVQLMCLPRADYDQLLGTDTHVNIGSGNDITLKALAKLITSIYRYDGSVLWDASKPDGVKRKLTDTRKLSSMGWKPAIPMREGLERVVTHYQDNHAQLRH